VRLTLCYAVLLVLFSVLLVGLLWWRVASYLERKTAAIIRADAQAIMDDFRYKGLPGAIEMINERLGQTANGSALYLLADAALKPVAGNLQAWPAEVGPKSGWYQVPLVGNDGHHVMQIENVALPGGSHLLVGRDIRDRIEIRALLLNSLSWAAAAAFLLGIVGGVLLRQAVLRRVAILDSTANAIVRGDLSRRLPTGDSTDEFDQLAQTINATLQQIEKLIEGVRNTSNAIAHDLRTPLAELRAHLEELIRARPPREAMLDGIYKAVADIDRVIGVFNALLRLAEIDSGVRRSGFRRVELGELAIEVAELYAPLIEEKQATFVLDAPDGLAVHGDPYLLAQAVGNLVDNAVKYTPCDGRVSLRIEPSGDGQLEITVADNGPGIIDAEKARVMQRFYRSRASDGAVGTGFGLSVVDAVARLHEGSLVLADNHPGLVASLKLPAASSATSVS
jgi:signal transduction histidine kinase